VSYREHRIRVAERYLRLFGHLRLDIETELLSLGIDISRFNP
jgi:hypothetical protein